MTKANAIFLTMFASAGLCASCSSQNDADTMGTSACSFDIQCKLDWICEYRRCVDPGGSGGAPAEEPREVQVSNTNIVANSLLADPSRGLVYATIPGSAPEHANRLIAIDANGEIASSILIGSEPTSMAISEDHATLWVSLRGSFSIRRVDLTGDEPRAGSEHPIPPRQSREGAAGPMVVLPGEPDSVAVSVHLLNTSPSFDGVVVLDAGVPRPERTPGHTGAARLTGGPQGYLFGFNSSSTGFQFYSIRISAQGLTQTAHVDLVDGFGVDIVYHDNRVFAESGAVVDVSDTASPRKEGVFAFHGSVIPQQDGTVIMLSDPASYARVEATLRLLDVATFTQLKSAPAGMAGANAVTSFVQIGPGRYAALVDDGNWRNKVYLLSAPSFER